MVSRLEGVCGAPGGRCGALLAGPFALVRTSETPEAKIDNLAEAMGIRRGRG